MSKDWEDWTRLDETAAEVPHRSVHRLMREKIEEIIGSFLVSWDSSLPRTFSIELKESDQFWTFVAKDPNRGFRSSGMMAKRRAYELRVQDIVRGLMTDYFIEYDCMPLKWGEYI
jgi:hypothetical protein